MAYFAVPTKSACVKGFGCRPYAAVPRRPAAGVRNPPREETAIGEGAAVPRGRYGDYMSAALSSPTSGPFFTFIHSFVRPEEPILSSRP
jgi:hypothetical protein